MRDDGSPPPVIDTARVIAHASTEAPVKWTGRQRLYVGEQLLRAVPRLAICQNISGPPTDFLLFHCDETWTVLGVTGAKTLEGAKESAEAAYNGVSSRWVTVDVSPEDAEAYLRRIYPMHVCSFCDRLFIDLDGLIQGSNASACHRCVDEMHSMIHAEYQAS